MTDGFFGRVLVIGTDLTVTTLASNVPIEPTGAPGTCGIELCCFYFLGRPPGCNGCRALFQELQCQFADGLGGADGGSARFCNPSGVAAGADGGVYVADTGNQRIRWIDGALNVTTLAGDGTAGLKDGPGPAAELSSPMGLAVDSGGNLYVADSGNHAIRRIDPGGNVTTVAGNGQPGDVDAQGAAARFNGPEAVALDAAANLYVADTGNLRIRVVDPQGNVTTLAGGGPLCVLDGPALSVGFAQPSGIAVDPKGTVYVADYGIGIRVIRRQ